MMNLAEEGQDLVTWCELQRQMTCSSRGRHLGPHLLLDSPQSVYLVQILTFLKDARKGQSKIIVATMSEAGERRKEFEGITRENRRVMQMQNLTLTLL